MDNIGQQDEQYINQILSNNINQIEVKFGGPNLVKLVA